METWFEALERLATLKERGVLTEEEFAREKAAVLDERNRSATNEQSPLDSQASWVRRNWLVLAVPGAVVIGGALAWAALVDLPQKGTFGRRPKLDGKASGEAHLTSGPAALNDVLVFTSAPTCTPGGDLDRLVRAMAAQRPTADGLAESIGIERLGVGVTPTVARLQPKADGPAVTVTQLPLKGAWQGLHLRYLRTVQWEGSPLRSFQLGFDDDVRQAATALKTAGFNSVQIGKLTVVDGSGGSRTAIGLEEIGGGSALTCAQGIPSGGDDAAAISGDGP